MPLKVLIAEDDPAVALYLTKAIEEVAGVDVVFTAGNGKEAISQAEIYQPDAVFLDIDMPEMNGMETAKELAELCPDMYIVFATAFPDYALKAFEFYPIDYILKPFSEARIRRTIRRVRDKVSEKQHPQPQQFLSFMIEVEKRKIFINSEELLYAESRGRKVFFKTEKREYLVTGNLTEVERKLSSQVFFRCHKSFLVNLKKIEVIMPSGRSFNIVLDSGDKVFLSREREKELRERFQFK